MARFAVVLSLCLLMASFAFPQGLDDPGSGILPFSTQVGGASESVDIATGNVHINIPVRSKAGKIPFDFSFAGNFHAWIAPTQTAHIWRVTTGLNAGVTGLLGDRLSYQAMNNPCGQNQIDEKFVVAGIVDFTGALHPAPAVIHSNPSHCGGVSSATVTALDGSGLTEHVWFDDAGSAFYNLYDKSGDTLTPNNPNPNSDAKLTDPDNVTMKKTHTMTSAGFYTDTLNTTAISFSLGASQGASDTYTFTGGDGQVQTFTINYTKYTQATTFNCQNVIELQQVSVYLPTSVVLNTTGATYELAYEQTSGYTTGRLEQITFPTGGTVSYAYSDSNGHNGIDCNSGAVPTLTRTVNDNNGNVSVWTYVNTNDIVGPGNYTVTADFPYAHSDSRNSTIAYSFSNGFQTQAKYYQGAATGTPLKTVLTCYNGHLTNCTNLTQFPSRVSQTDVYTSFDTSASNHMQTIFDSYGNVTSLSKSDYGGTVVSTTSTVYSTGSNCGATGSNIHDRTCSVTTTSPSSSGTCGSTSNCASQANFTYNAGGHPTVASKWVSGTSYLTSSAAYGTNGAAAGVLSAVTEVNGATTNYKNFVCNGVLPTTINYPLSLTASQTWDSACNGGVMASSTDASQNPTTYSYADPLWRMISVTDQDYPGTNFKYPDATHVESYLNFGTTSTVDTTTTTDGLGRPILVEKAHDQAKSSFDSVQYQYGWNATGAFTKQSMPYSGSPSAWTTTQYDAAGRVSTVTDADTGTVAYTYIQNDVLQTRSSPSVSKQLEYDGLGRLASVCEITSGSGSGSCGQKNPATGFLTKYTYDPLGNLLTVTQNAQPGAIGGTQTRTYNYDGLGRLTQESNPENGMTQYFWDAAPSACLSPSGYPTPGDLGSKRDNAGVYICYGYDSLHRLLGFNPNSEINCTGLVYDSATPPNGVTVQNTKGRLLEAYTNSACNGHQSLVTDKWFSYSPRGEVTDIYSSTSNSGGYYHLGKTYWANGVVNTLSGIPGVPTITYGVDGEGRWNTVSASTGVNPVTATSYNAASQVTGITFGTTSSPGDSDSYLYDAAGRMKQYTFSVNGSSVIGKPTWNSNGTLQKFQVTQDPFNPPNVQTCTYTYDDLGRLGGKDASGYSVNCGNTWAQTFSFDPFGNITKTGSVSWQPTYASPTNNQYLSGWNGVSYDNDGHLTNDTFHTYQWDANGHAIGVGSSSYQSNQTYDAQGNLAEQNIPSPSYTAQYLYDEHGAELGFAHAQSPGWTWIPLPGGGNAIYVSGSVRNYWHADWLGSVRFGSTPSRTMYSDQAYAPFGEPYAPAGSGDQSFAGLKQNLFPDLFETPNREYHPTQGRWITPDPAGLGAADPTNPQSWNRYAYVLNNPLSFIDPLGLECVWDDGSFDSNDDPRTGNTEQGRANCASDKGTWYEPTDFANRGLGDWSPNGNAELASEIQQMQGGDPAATFNAKGTAFADVGGADPVAWQASMQNFLLAPIKGLIPKVCGSGGFAYGGGAFDLGKAHAELLGLVEYDSTTGGSHGGLFGGGLGQSTFGVESMRNWSSWQSSTTPIGIGGPSFQMPGPLNGMKGDAGGFLQFDNGQLNIGGYLGGTGIKGGRSAGAGGYLRLSWSGC